MLARETYWHERGRKLRKKRAYDIIVIVIRRYSDLERTS